MSFDKANPNAGGINRVNIYCGAHDLTLTFTLIKDGEKLLVTIIEATNTSTGKDTGLSDERLIAEVMREIKSRNILVFNYTETPR